MRELYGFTYLCGSPGGGSDTEVAVRLRLTSDMSDDDLYVIAERVRVSALREGIKLINGHIGTYRYLRMLRDLYCPRIERRVAAGGHPLGEIR